MKDEMFSILPLHFAPSTLEDLNRLGWNIILPSYEHYPESFKSVVPYLLATLVYHEHFLRENLNRNHPIFQARVLTDGYVSMLKDKVILGLGSCPYTGMQSSGVPQSLRLATKIAEVTKEMDELKTTIKRKLDDVSAYLSEEMDSLPIKLTNEMKSNFEITGMIQVTRNDMLKMFSEFINQLRHEFRQQQQMEQNAYTAVNNASSTDIHRPQQLLRLGTGVKNSPFHMVPQGFKLPLGLKVKAIWDLCRQYVQTPARSADQATIRPHNANAMLLHMVPAADVGQPERGHEGEQHLGLDLEHVFVREEYCGTYLARTGDGVARV
ncbi:unnamed protein product [Sphagnum balticum]